MFLVPESPLAVMSKYPTTEKVIAMRTPTAANVTTQRQFVAYYRLSKESRSGGLGLDAQRQTVTAFLASAGGGSLLAEFTEIESGRKTDRAELLGAIALCRKSKARLVIAKLDRLARNAAFLLALRDSGVDFVAADMPYADRLTVGILALFAEHERDMISRRTKEALFQAKLRGIKLGCPTPKRASLAGCRVRTERANQFAKNVFPIIRDIQAAGVVTYRGIATALTSRGIRSRTNKPFSPQSVVDVIDRAQSQLNAGG